MKKWATRTAVAISVVVLVAVGLRLLSTAKSKRRIVVAGNQPELIRVAATEVTIAWRTKAAIEGAVTFAPIENPEQSKRVSEETGPGEWHEIVVKGLTPGTRYGYSITSDEPSYEFQTQPTQTTPFSYLFVWGKPGDDVASAAMSELPEFVFSMTPLKKDDAATFDPLRPLMPIYDLHGPSSPYLRAMSDAASSVAHGPGWALDWGGLRLIQTANVEGLRARLADAKAHTIGVVWASYQAREWADKGEINKTKVAASPVHNAVTTHNGQSREHAASFVIFVAQTLCSAEIDGVLYLGLPAEATQSVVARVDVSVESTRMVVLGADKEFVLRKPPLNQKRTCEECRRLADQGAYEDSVLAYTEFIRTNPTHFQIDDAYFATAEILDEKLFRFADAVTWYERLVDKYPESTLAPAARLRLDFLKTHSDHDYKPLAEFERIRRVDYGKARQIPEKRDRVLARLEGCIKKYPDCAVAKQMRYWLANQLRSFDVDRATVAYRALIAKYPDSEEAKNAWMEMGEAYYDHGRYTESMALFREALAVAPDRADVIQPQINRAARNQRRGHVAIAAYLMILLCLIPPLIMARSSFRWWRVVVAAGVGVVLLGLMIAGACFLHEQFESIDQAVILCAGFALSAVVGYPILACLHHRFSGVKGRLIAMLLNLVILLAGCYLTLYHWNEHYLVILKM